jgi:hypothetical protein
MDFDFHVPEEIKEEDEESRLDEATEDEGTAEVHTPEERELEATPPSRPTPPPKPAERNGWKLPTSDSQVVLRKTTNENIQEVKSEEELEESRNDITPQSSPEKKQKERKRFKMHLFKFRRSRKGKQNAGKTPSTESEGKTNLTETYSMSVDSGLNSERSRRRWPNRRSQKSKDEKGLSWLLGIFHKKHGSNKDTKDAERTPEEAEDITEGAKGAPNIDNTDNHSDTNSNGNTKANGTAPEVELSNGPEVELSNGDTSVTSHEEDDTAKTKQESVSNLRQKFERFSMVF